MSLPENDLGQAYEKACYNDATLHVLRKGGATMQEIVVALVADKERLRKRVLELELIAPKRIVLPNGQEAIYRCPDELVPRVELP